MHNVGQHLFSGALSGLVSTICLQPFDLLKTRVQQGDGTVGAKNTAMIMRTIREIVATTGPSGLWRGTTATLVRNVPGVALYMTSVTQLRTVMAASPYFASSRPGSEMTKSSSVLPTLTSQGNLIAGAAARVSVGFLLNPFSVLKARFESSMYSYPSLTGAFVTIVRSGPSELLRGFLASSLRDAPYAGIFIAFYEGIKRESSILVQPTSSIHTTAIHSFSAASAGAIATMATQPFDVIKTKVQVRREGRYQRFGTTVKTIWSQRGVSGFFDGASLRMSRKILSSAIGWAVYEGFLLFVRTSEFNNGQSR